MQPGGENRLMDGVLVMRNLFTRKRVVALAGAAALVVGAGTVLAYWSTSGTGTGAGSTATGNATAITVHQSGTLSAMYPGDSPQALTFTLQNTDLNQKLHVASVSVAVTDVLNASNVSIFGTCNGSDFTIVQPSAATVAREVNAASTSAVINSGTIQFNDKSA